MDKDFKLKTRRGHNMYDMASMLQKAIRRGDYERAGYAAYELADRFRNYLWRRLLIISAEDCYGIITKEIIALKLSDDILMKNKTGGDIFLCKAITLLCECRKNRDACYFGCNYFNSDTPINEDDIEHVNIEECKLLNDEIPDWVFDCHTITGKIKGRTIDEMIINEQKALHPHQIGMFDNEPWDNYLDKYYHRK